MGHSCAYSGGEGQQTLSRDECNTEGGWGYSSRSQGSRGYSSDTRVESSAHGEQMRSNLQIRKRQHEREAGQLERRRAAAGERHAAAEQRRRRGACSAPSSRPRDIKGRIAKQSREQGH